MVGQPDRTPGYLQLSEPALSARVAALWRRYEHCDLCGHACGVDRTAGETGVCGADDTAVVSGAFAHHGEEDVLRGHGGSGTIFLANCNMGCAFCQNFETSQEGQGDPVTPEAIAEMALELQSSGVHNVNFVSPTHYAPHLVEAIEMARDRGLSIPVVWNCGGYERSSVLADLEGIVDIYMPDVKWSDDASATRYSGTPDYWTNCKNSLREMHRQVGDLAVDADGLATRGLLVRHLVMPNHVENSKGVLSFLADEISPETYVNLMSQYRPAYRVVSAAGFEELDRRITADEYGAVLSHARDVGLERVDYDASMVP